MNTQMKIGDVSRLTGFRTPTLCRWADRGTLKPNRRDKATTGHGDHRTFSRDTIVQIAIAKPMIELGISAGAANAAASLFTDHGQPGRSAGEPFAQGRTLLILRPTGPVVINPEFDAEFSEMAASGIAFAAVDCGKVCNEIDSLINNRKTQ